MKKIFFFILLATLLKTVIAQQPRWYEFNNNNYTITGPFTFPDSAIADDFGPRDYGNDDFHGGIDYNCSYQAADAQKWNMVVSPQYSYIFDFNGLIQSGNFYKRLITLVFDEEHNESYSWVFGHAFDDDQQFYDLFDHHIILKYCEFPNNDKWGLYLNLSNEVYCYSQVPNAEMKVNNVLIPTTNEVNDLDPVIPIGNSGGNYTSHLHLNTIPYGTNTDSDLSNGSPLQYISYIHPAYIITASSPNSQSSVSLHYPGDEPTKVKIRPAMVGELPNNSRYYHVFDINTIELEWKYQFLSNSFFQTIRGDEKNNIISIGSRLNELKLNHPSGNIYPNNFPLWNENGILSNAYNSNSSGDNAPHPWDDYYFIDFPTRIHIGDQFNNISKFANYPSLCKYKDGPYDFRAKFWRTDNSYEHHANQAVVLDNWWPFVEKVEMDWGLQHIYDAQWNPNSTGTCGLFQPNTINALVSGISAILPIVVTAYTSEPMSEIFLDVDDWNIQNLPGQAYHISQNEFKYKFSIPSSNVTNFGMDIIFKFHGKDFSNNNLIAFDTPHAQYCQAIPYRGVNGFINNSQLPSGTDVIHRFYLRQCGEQSMQPSVGVTSGILISGVSSPAFSPDQNCADGAIDLEISGGFSPYEIQWFKNGVSFGPSITSYGNDGLEDLNNIAYGNYSVLVTDALCGTSTINFDVQVQENIISIISVKNNSICYEYENHPGFYASADGSIDISINYDLPYTVLWTGIGYSSNNEDISGLCPGTYTIYVTNEAGCTIRKSIDICCCSQPNRQQSVTFAPENSCYLYFLENGAIPYCEDADYSINIEEGNWESSNNCNGFIYPEILGGANTKYFKWTLPDGSIATTYYLDNLCAGTYCLQVTDGCSSDQFCWTISDCSSTQIEINSNVENTCISYEVGSIELFPNGGNSPYSYTWSNYSHDMNLYNLPVGEYCVTVLDNFHCKATSCFDIDDPVEAILDRNLDPCEDVYSCNGKPVKTISYGFNYLPNGVQGQGLYNYLNNNWLRITGCNAIKRCRDIPLGQITEEIEITSTLYGDDECVMSVLCNGSLLFNNWFGSIEYSAGDVPNTCKKLCVLPMNASVLFPNETDDIIFIDELEIINFNYTYECIDGQCKKHSFCDGNPISTEDVSCTECDRNSVRCCIAIRDLSIVDTAITETDRNYSENDPFTINYTNDIVFDIIGSFGNTTLLPIDQNDSNYSKDALDHFEKTQLIKIYPNPAKTVIDLELLSDFEDNSKMVVNILNTLGIEVLKLFLNTNDFENNIYSIDVNQLVPGIYYINIANDKALLDTKMITIIE